MQLADALTEILKRNMYNVDTVYNGIDGLDNALTGIYDGIILDIMLPGMNGIEILQNIRKELANFRKSSRFQFMKQLLYCNFLSDGQASVLVGSQQIND